MDCRITSITRAAGRGRRRVAGYSLIETWIGLLLSILLTMTVVSFTMYTGKTMVGLSNYVDLEARTQKGLDQMSKDIRQTKGLTSISTNQLVFQDADDLPLTFSYSPDRKTLVRLKNGVTTTLLTECDYLCFSNYQRNPVNGQYDQYPVTTSPTNTKLVSLTWVCSRKIMGTSLNTESVQTAKIVIRKQ
jgi:Tfp pilus assembly protein PilW